MTTRMIEYITICHTFKYCWAYYQNGEIVIAPSYVLEKFELRRFTVELLIKREIFYSVRWLITPMNLKKLHFSATFSSFETSICYKFILLSTRSLLEIQPIKNCTCVFASAKWIENLTYRYSCFITLECLNFSNRENGPMVNFQTWVVGKHIFPVKCYSNRTNASENIMIIICLATE